MCRNILRGAVQAILLFNYGAQIWALLLIDLFYCALTVKMRKFFINNFFFIMFFLYNAAFFVFDLFFMIEYNFSNLNMIAKIDREMFGFVMIILLIAFPLLQSFYFLFSALYSVFLKLCPKKENVIFKQKISL